MPTYKVTDPATGKTVRLTGDAPPTEAELAQVFASLQPAAPTQTPEPAPSSAMDTVKDSLVGMGKGAASTVFGLADVLIRKPLGLERVVDTPEVRALTTPTNTAQKVGKAAEQIGEFFIPTGAPAKLAKAAEVAKSGLLTLAQGGSPAAAGVSAGLTAVLPGAKAVQSASSMMQSAAQKEMAQALGATKEWAKAEAAKLAPKMLARGIGGSRDAMLATAERTAARVGAALDDAYRTAAAAGETISGDIIRGHLQLATDALKVELKPGVRAVVPGTERVISRLERLDRFVETLGPDIPVDTAAKLKRTWDHIVSKAGLYGPKAAASATDSADSWAFREAATAFRDVLNSNPTIDALNKEAAFWTGLKNVLKETQKRTQAQAGTGLVQAGAGGAGVIAGALSGDSTWDRAQNAFIGGVAGRNLTKLVQSPAFRTQVSGPMKQLLADALASGSAGRIANATTRVAASLPAQLSASPAP